MLLFHRVPRRVTRPRPRIASNSPPRPGFGVSGAENAATQRMAMGDVSIPLQILLLIVGILSFLAGRWFESNERREDDLEREAEAE